MRLSRIVLAACIAVLPVVGHAQAPDPDSANNVMKGCRAILAKSKHDTFLRGVWPVRCMLLPESLGIQNSASRQG
jgi:hypothetical protein